MGDGGEEQKKGGGGKGVRGKNIRNETRHHTYHHPDGDEEAQRRPHDLAPARVLVGAALEADDRGQAVHFWLAGGLAG